MSQDQSDRQRMLRLPISASVAMRLHEAGKEEEQAKMVYVLCACMGAKERWLVGAFKRPQDLKRWCLAGSERWGLAPEFEPLRRLARAEEWSSISEGAQGRFNEVVRSRASHLACLWMCSPRLDHVYWSMVGAAMAFGVWGASQFGEWVAESKGMWGALGAWMFCSALMAACLKSAIYVWQDSSLGIGSAMKALVWGHRPQEDACQSMALLGVGLGALAESDRIEPPMEPHGLSRKAKSGKLTALEALELSRSAKRSKLWRDDLAQTLEKFAKAGESLISASKEPGWALARLESLELRTHLESSEGQAEGCVAKVEKGSSRL